jgi:tetratricopeptide (TPR) repeat protein
MKSFLLIGFLTLAACSTTKVQDSKPENKSDSITKESFKKEKALTNAEVSDYYPGAKTLNPALQDETLDRYSVDELAKISGIGEPLMEISIRCSKKDYDQAFAVASKAFNRYQKIPAYWNLIGNCHLNQGSQRKALLFYNKALEVSPGYVPALNNIGVMYSRQGEDQKALVAFERANKQSPFSKTPRYNLARLYLSYGLADSALPLFQGMLNDSPNDIDLLNAVANCYFILSDYQKAAGYFSRIPTGLYERAEIGLNFALTLKKQGNNGEATKIFQSIEKPKSKELRDYYATVGNQLGDQ